MKKKKNSFGKIKKFATEKNYRTLCLCNAGVFNWMDDEKYLKLRYKAAIGEDLNLNHPQTFNEKLQWLKLYDRKPVYTKLVDKYEVKKYVASKIGEQYIIPTYGVWNNFSEIDFNILPDQFVLKCTHDSGGIVICHNKQHLNMDATREKINKCLKHNYYWVGREFPYKNVKPRIIAEQYLTNQKDDKNLTDYKLFCFNGKPIFTLVCTERYSKDGLKETFYDNDWNRLPIKRARHDVDSNEHRKPYNFDLMLNFANILSKDIPFLRVDFFEINNRLYFGEITFYPSSGFEGFQPEECDYKLGNILKIV